MVAKTILALAPAGTLDGTEQLEGVQGVNSVKLTTQAVADLSAAAIAAAIAGVSVPSLIFSTQTGTSYTFVLGDANHWIDFTNGSAVTVTIPANASVAFPINTPIIVEQAGGGAVTIVAGAGVAPIQSAGGLVTTNGQYAVATLVKKATNTWSLSGNLT